MTDLGSHHTEDEKLKVINGINVSIILLNYFLSIIAKLFNI